MPDPSQSPSPAQVLAGNPPPLADAPLNARPGTPPTLPAQPPPQPPAPTPQQVVAARHNALGQVTSFLFGNQRDPNTGEPVKQQPGAIFRSLLAGALLGGAIGSEGRSTSPVGGFISGLARGGNAVAQQEYARQQAARQAALERQRMSLDEQRAADEHVLHQATAAKVTAETAALHHQQEFIDQDELDKKNAAAAQYVRTLTDAGGTPAPIAINGRIPSNGIYSAPDLAAAYMKDPSILMGPRNTVRHFIDTHDASDLEYKDGVGWVNQNGDPVDLSKSTTVRVIDVPESLYRTRVHPTGKEINAIAGYQLIPRDQEGAAFNVPLDAISGLYAQNLKNANEAAQAKARNAAANKANKAATTKRGTPAQFAAVEAKKAAALAKAEAAFQKNGDEQELATSKAAAQKAYEAEIVALGGSVGQAAPNAPKKGDTQVHAGFNYTFDGTQWIKGSRAQ